MKVHYKDWVIKKIIEKFGYLTLMLFGDTLVLDRWFWLRKKLPKTFDSEKLLDVGCGSGAFTIGLAKRGYRAIGLSWDEKNNKKAIERSKLVNAESVKFEKCDVRVLGDRKEFYSQFDVIICLENIEHIIDDKKLIKSMTDCLKPGGHIYLTTPNLYYNPISRHDMGPFEKIEDGRHVRRGYNKAMLEELCQHSKLEINSIEFCSGFLSQKITKMHRYISKINKILSFIVTFPLRLFPILFDKYLTKLLDYPHYSICLSAYKKRD